MKSNNGSMSCKNAYLSFINKKLLLGLFSVLIALILICAYFMVAYWNEMPIAIKILGPIIMAIAFVGILITPLNGMYINKNGAIIFVSDFRIKRIKVNDVAKLEFIFEEWENKKFSVIVKIACVDGSIFTKDYSKQFCNMPNNKLARSVYTISSNKVDKIQKQVVALNNCVVTVVDKDKNVVFSSL